MLKYVPVSVMTVLVFFAVIWAVCDFLKNPSDEQAMVKTSIVLSSQSRVLPAMPSISSSSAPTGKKNGSSGSASVVQGVTILPNANLSTKPGNQIPVKPNPNALLLISSSSGKRPNYIGGELAAANILVGGKAYSMQPNQVGDFGRLVMEANTSATVQIAYPQASPQDPVIIEVMDGGLLGNGKDVQMTQLDGTSGVTFQFQSGTQQGIYRVNLVQGSDTKVIDFWVGPLPQVAAAR